MDDERTKAAEEEGRTIKEVLEMDYGPDSNIPGDEVTMGDLADVLDISKITSEIWRYLLNRRKARRQQAESYRDQFKDNPAALLDEIDKRLQEVSREKDFYPFIEEGKAEAIKEYKRWQEEETDPEELEMIDLYIKETYSKNYVGFYNYLQSCLTLQIWAYLGYFPGDYQTIIDRIKKRATDPADGYRERKAGVSYEETRCILLASIATRKPISRAMQLFSKDDPMGFTSIFQGPGTNDLVKMNSDRDLGTELDPAADTWAKRSGDYQITLPGDLGVRASCFKLLYAAQAALSTQNTYKSKGPYNLTVRIPLEDYIVWNRGKITANNIKSWRRKIDKDLQALYSASVSWKERPKGKRKWDYKDVRIITGKGIRQGFIEMDFSPAMGSYLINAYVNLFPLGAMLQIDEVRHSLAVPIFSKLAWQSANDNNAQKGTSHILKTTTIMEACGDYLPTYDDVRKSKDRHPDRRIVYPIVRELNYLQDQGWILWNYCNANNAELEADQLDLIEDDGRCPYDLFKDLRIYFEIKGTPDQTDRRQKNAETKARRKDLQEKATARALADKKVKEIQKAEKDK